MTVPLSLVARQFRLTGLAACIDAAGAGRVVFYPAPTSGPLLPATPETDPGQTPLVTVALAGICGTVGAAGYLATLTFTVPRSGNVAQSGTIAWARITNGADAGVLDLPAGLIDSGQPVEVSDLVVYEGGEVLLANCVISE